MYQLHARILTGLSLAVAILDGILKLYAIKRLPEAGARFDSIIGFALHKNPGIAFNIPIPLWIVVTVTIVISAYLTRVAIRTRISKPLTCAFAMTVLAGALGNMVDRIVNGFTTDYIILFNRSAINLSDILIVIGIIGLLGYTERKENR